MCHGKRMPAGVALPDDVTALIRQNPGRIISTRQLNRLGQDSWRITEWVRTGCLERVVRGWFRQPHTAVPNQEAYLALAHLQANQPGSPAVISGEHALRAAGCELAPTGPPLVLMNHGRRLRLSQPPFRVAQRSEAGTVPVQYRGRLAVTPPAYALADLVTEHPRSDDELRAVLYRAVNRLALPPTELMSTWRGMNHPGARRLLRLADEGALEHESPAEYSLFQQVFTPFGPQPDCQVLLTPSIRVDFVYLFAAFVIEYYGEDAHAGRVDRDGTRVYALCRLGNEVLVVTKSMTTDPASLAQHIHQVRRHREDLVLRGELARPPLPRQPDRLTPLRTLLPSG